MNKTILSFFVISAVFLGVFAFAQTITGSFLVNANSCSETDGGLNYATYGSVTGSFWWPTGNFSNGTYIGTFTDVCVSNTTLLEGVCGSSISANYSNLAGAVYVDCSTLSNSSTSWGCQNGRCLIIVGGGSCGGGNSTNSTNSTGGGGNSTNSTLRPDLIVSNLMYTYVANGTISLNNTNFTSYRVFVNATIRNSGNAVAGASSTRMMLSQIINGASRISTQSFSTPALSVGQSTIVSGILSGLSGFSNLQADADSANVIVESNEANNVMVVNATLP